MAIRKQILFVDDDCDIANGARLRLETAGYTAIVAASGEEAVAAAIEKQPDVIVLDIRMPGMDGLAALAKLRERKDTQHIPVLVLSASLIDQPDALEKGARFFLRKPYCAETLLSAIDVAVNEKSHGPRILESAAC